MSQPNNPFDAREIRKSVQRRAVNSAAALALGRPMLVLVNLGGAMILARILAPHDYGLFGMVVVAVRMAEVFREMGLGTVAIQREALSPDQQAGLFWTNTVFALLIGALLALSAPLIVGFYGEPALAGLTYGVAAQFVLNGLSTQHLALIKRQLNFKGLVIVQFCAAALAVLAAVGAAKSGAGPYALVVRAVTEAVANAIGLRLITRWSPGRPRGFVQIIEELKFGLNITFTNMTAFLSRQADNLIVGKFFGAEALGTYQKSYELMMMPLQHVTRPASGIGVAALSRLAAEPEKYRRAYFRMVEKILLVSVPFAALLMGASEVVVAILLGPQWGAVVPLATVLGFVSLLQPITTTVTWLLTTQNQPNVLLRASLLNAALDLAGFAVGAQWGPLGIAMSYSLGQLVKVPISVSYQLRHSHVSARDIFRATGFFCGLGILAAAAVASVSHVCRDNHLIVRAMASGGTAVVAYYALLLAFPQGRRALQDVATSVSFLRARR